MTVLTAAAVLLVLLSTSSWSRAQLLAAQIGFVVDCSLTFAQLDNVNNTVQFHPSIKTLMPIPLHYNQAVTCLINCTSQRSPSNTSNSTATVFGFFPYSPISSICLAAIHAGIIADAAGGGLLISRFYRHDWSNSSTQTIYPFDSWRGSVCNGVLSGDVDDSSHRIPAGRLEWSYSVRGRGDFIVQRRQTPFSPRAGHVHESFLYRSVFPNGTVVYFQVQLFIGGYNGTHYLKDVHVTTAPMDAEGTDWTWYQLDAAPFTPRSDTLVARDQGAFRLVDGHWPPVELYVIGGQVSHACGLYELGVCSRKVWMMNITVNELTGMPSITWNERTPLSDAMSARCGSGILSSSPPGTYTLVAGQLSYNDSSCSTPPTTVSEQWRLVLDSQSVERIVDAPFSPRRWGGGSGAAVKLVGGIRHLNVSHGASDTVRLSASEVHASVWNCPPDAGFGCYSRYYNTSWNGTILPSVSVPVPTSAGGGYFAFHSTGMTTAQPSVVFGGVLPAAAIEQWRNTRPIIDRGVIDVEWDELKVNGTLVTEYVPGPADVMIGRMQLPLTAVMDELELNNRDGNYVLGAGWASGSSYQFSYGVAVSLYERPRAFADSVNDSSWWTPMATSSSATHRPLLNFDLRLRDHSTTGELMQREGVASQLVWSFTAALWNSGGRSGELYYNDVMLSLPMLCLSPADPSYRAALGPMQVAQSSSKSSVVLYNVARPMQIIYVYCPARYHFEPPSLNVFVELACHADSIWVDAAAHTVRRCVRDVLNCTWPLVDLGLDFCQPSPPVVNDVSLSYMWNGSVTQLNAGQDMVVTNVPPNYVGPVMLTVRGSLFIYPVSIWVNSNDCPLATLSEPSQFVCYNVTDPDRSQPYYICDQMSQQVTCELPRVFGVDMKVLIDSGRSGERAAMNATLTDNQYFLLMSAAPRITRLAAADCRVDQPLSLTECPFSHAFSLTVCAASDSIAIGREVPVTLGGRALHNCTAFVGDPGQAEYCAQCIALPQYGGHLPVVIVQRLGLYSDTTATLSFADCPAGTMLNTEAVLSGAANLCITCPAGSSTTRNSGQVQCTLCPAGTYSNTGDADCSPCAAGQYSPSSNSSSCLLCPLNSYANDTRQTGCQSCSLNDYIVYSSVHNRTRPIDGECVACPAGATCTIDGDILAAAGQYLLIDQQAATVAGIRCSSSACVSAAAVDSGDAYQQQQPMSQVIIASQLRMVNSCGRNRWPAYVNISSVVPLNDTGVSTGTDDLLPNALRDSDGVNVLCAHCLPGYSSVNGRCVECSSVQWGALFGLLLLALLLVYAVHRLPHDWTGSATLSIVAYFVQLSAMYKASDLLPQLFALVNLQLLGGYTSTSQSGTTSAADDGTALAVCVVPLDDVGRAGMAFASPVIAFGLLGVVAVVQAAMYAAQSASGRDDDEEQNESGHGSSSLNNRSSVCLTSRRVYGWLFVPARPRSPSTVAVSHNSAIWASEAGRSQLLVEERSVPLIGDLQPSEQHSGVMVLTSKQYVWRAYQRSIVRLLLLSYSGLSLVTLSCLHWQSVGEYGWRLTDFSTIAPGSSEWRVLLPVVVLVLVVVFVAPLALLLFLWHQHRGGYIAEAKQKLQRPGADGSLLSTREQLVLQLTAMFRTEYWWMPAYVLVRRLLAAVLLVSVRSSSLWTWLTIAGFVQLCTHLQLRPYERAIDNDFESLTLLSLSLQTALLSAYPPPVSSGHAAALTGTTTALIVAPLVVIALSVAVRAYRQRRAACHHQQHSQHQLSQLNEL